MVGKSIENTALVDGGEPSETLASFIFVDSSVSTIIFKI